jgi:hypothetical protein
MSFSKLTAGFLLLVCAALLVAQSSYPLVGRLTGKVTDYWPTHQDIQGDTQYSTITGATTVNGTNMGTTTLNRNDGAGNVTITGAVIAMINDGIALGGNGNITLYRLNTLDVSNPANIRTTLVNAMSSFGTGSEVNAPVGWYGKATSNNLTYYNANWKSGPIESVGGWLILPVIRQGVGVYNAHDSTLVASPDGGAHWCNPYTFFHHIGSPGCDATNWDANGTLRNVGRRHTPALARIRLIWILPTPRLCGQNPRLMMARLV